MPEEDTLDQGRENELDQEAFVTIGEICRRYSIKRATAGDWLRDGLIPGERMGGRWYTTWDAVFSFERRLCPPQGGARKAAKRPLLTVADLAVRFSVKETTIREWLRKGVLPGTHIQGTWYVAPDDLERTSGLDRLGQRKGTARDTNTKYYQSGAGTS